MVENVRKIGTERRTPCSMCDRTFKPSPDHPPFVPSPDDEHVGNWVCFDCVRKFLGEQHALNPW